MGSKTGRGVSPGQSRAMTGAATGKGSISGMDQRVAKNVEGLAAKAALKNENLNPEMVDRFQQNKPFRYGNPAIPNQNAFKNFFGDHDNFTDQLKFNKTIPNYHQLGALDFMARFPGADPNLAKNLAKGYQYTTEGAKAILDGPGGFTIEDAFKRAKEEAELNSIGIDSFANPESEIYAQYQNLIPETGRVALANGGPVANRFSGILSLLNTR